MLNYYVNLRCSFLALFHLLQEPSWLYSVILIIKHNLLCWYHLLPGAEAREKLTTYLAFSYLFGTPLYYQVTGKAKERGKKQTILSLPVVPRSSFCQALNSLYSGRHKLIDQNPATL